MEQGASNRGGEAKQLENEDSVNSGPAAKKKKTEPREKNSSQAGSGGHKSRPKGPIYSKENSHDISKWEGPKMPGKGSFPNGIRNGSPRSCIEKGRCLFIESPGDSCPKVGERARRK